MRDRLAREEGFALAFALLVCVVMIITVVSVISYTSSSSRSANVSTARVSALHLAEAGIAEANSLLNHATNASDPTLLGCSTTDLVNSVQPCTDITVASNDGTTSLHGLYAQQSNSGVWTITSTGTVRNPTGGSDLSKSMTATVTITGGGTSNNISVWNYMYSTAPDGPGCEVDVTGTQVVIDVPLYITGDLCLSGTQSAVAENIANGGQHVDLRVGGLLEYIGTQSTVGYAGTPITSGLVSGGCVTTTNPTPHTCTSPADPWYIGQTDSPITATPPSIDFATWYDNASPGPKNICDTSLTSSPNLTATTNVFDNNATMDGSNPQFDLTPSSSYNCVTSSGSLSWNKTTKILTVSGTMFFDGDLTSSNSGAMYHGKATIYVNGQFLMTGTHASLHAGCPGSPSAPTHQCDFSDVSSEWDPNKDNIIVVANKASGDAILFSGTQAEYQGGLWCSPGSTAAFSGTQTKIEGPVICGHYDWGTQTKIFPLPTITNLPPGAPVPPNAPATIGQPVITG